MDEVLLDAEGGRYLRLRRKTLRDSDGIWSYYATVAFPEGEATVEVHDSGNQLAPFVRELADAWRGFQGRREYASLEGQLLLTCRHDGLGSVICTAQLRQPWPPEWCVEAVLEFGGGAHLERIAGKVEAFVDGAA